MRVIGHADNLRWRLLGRRGRRRIFDIAVSAERPLAVS